MQDPRVALVDPDPAMWELGIWGLAILRNSGFMDVSFPACWVNVLSRFLEGPGSFRLCFSFLDFITSPQYYNHNLVYLVYLTSRHPDLIAGPILLQHISHHPRGKRRISVGPLTSHLWLASERIDEEH